MLTSLRALANQPICCLLVSRFKILNVKQKHVRVALDEVGCLIPKIIPERGAGRARVIRLQDDAATI